MQHKAHTYKFEDLVLALEKEVKAGYINKIEDENSDLVIYDYSRDCMVNCHWSEACCLARGLVLSSGHVVATPYEKFFNYGERDTNTPQIPFEIFDKADGSMGIIYFYDGEWRVNTRGSFQSDQAAWAKNWFDTHANTRNLKEGDTYLCEIIYPENRIVVDYNGESFLSLHGGFDSNGRELNLSEIQNKFSIDSDSKEIRLVDTFSGKTIQDLLYLAKSELSANEEGFVVRFENGFRLKIKGDKYIALHKILSHFSEKTVMEFVRDFPNEDIFANENFNELPEEFFEELAFWNNKYKLLFETYLSEGLAFVKENKTISNKEVGLMKGAKTIKPNVADVFFAMKNGKFKEYYKPSLVRRRVFNKLYKAE